MRKKRLLFICATCVLFAAACAAAVSAVSGETARKEVFGLDTMIPVPSPTDPDRADYEEMMARRAAEDEAFLKEWEENSKDLWTKSYERATPEQRQRLEEQKARCEGNSACYEHPREIMTIMGDLPPDTPYLTLEQAREICASFDMDQVSSMDQLHNEIVRRFHEIAVVPDYAGGSGTTIHSYYLDADHSARIAVHDGHVEYYDCVTGASETLFPLFEEVK